MFSVQYRTIGQNGRIHPSKFATIGAHKAQSEAEAAAYVLSKFGNVEIIGVQYIGSL